MKNNILKNEVATLVLRLLLVVAVMWILRVAFYLYNIDVLGAITWSEIPALFKGAFIFDSANMAYTFGLFVIVSLLPFRFRQHRIYQKTLNWLFILLITVLTFWNLSDTIYFHFTRRRSTIDELSGAGENNALKSMIQAATENWAMVIFWIVLMAGIIYLYRKIKSHNLKINGARYYLINSAIFVIAIFALVTAMRGGIGRAIRPITISNAAQFASTPLKANVVLSNPFCILRTMGNKTIHYTRYFSPEQLDKLYTPIHHGVDSTEMNRKNVVIFILESFSYEHSAYLNPELYAGQPSYTPFLDSLMQTGYIFDHCFANGGKSIDALPSILASIPSFKTSFALTPQALSPIDGLGSVLEKQGWQSWFFNGSERRSMGFVAFARSSGISNFRTREDYEATNGTNDYDGNWGIWDDPFLKYMAHELGQARQPFLATTFTLTSHHPFVVPEQYRDILPKGHTKAQQPVAYTDMAMRHFFDIAKQQEWYKNTIFVAIADHASSEVYDKASLTDTGRSHIMYFIYTPDSTVVGRSSEVTQQIDLMPTVLGMLGYNKPYFAFGQDFFARDRKPGYAINYTGTAFQWIDGSGNYIFDEVNSLKKPAVDTAVKAFVQRYYQQMENHEFR